MDDLVKRLRAFANGCRGSIWQSRNETIRLCDDAADAIEALQARVKELDTTISNLRKVNDQYLKNSNENFHAANTARRDAFEEAAKVAEREGVYPELNVWKGGPDWHKHGRRIAAAIRALAEKG